MSYKLYVLAQEFIEQAGSIVKGRNIHTHEDGKYYLAGRYDKTQGKRLFLKNRTAPMNIDLCLVCVEATPIYK